jgi:RNA polymerase sigma-70 factor (ECF subfamily)
VSLDEAEEGVRALAAGDASCPMRAAAHQQRLARLGEALQELPERQREAFVLSRFDGLTQDEVAARMQISRRMVVKHLARAIAYCEVRVHYATVAQMQQLHRPAGDDAGLDKNNNSDSASS